MSIPPLLLPSTSGDEVDRQYNRPGRYTISFKPDIVLDGDYEVGISEFISSPAHAS